MSELLTKEEAARRAREVIIDTGCNWTEAADKVLEGIRLSTEDRKYLLALGLANLARASLNRTRANEETKKVTTADDLLEPIEGFLAMGRVFKINGNSKAFLDCDAADITYIIEHLKAQRDGFTRSIKFMVDVQAECERFKCKVKDLSTFHLFEKKAPW